MYNTLLVVNQNISNSDFYQVMGVNVAISLAIVGFLLILSRVDRRRVSQQED